MGGNSRKEGEEKTGLADLSEIRALNRLYFGVILPANELCKEQVYGRAIFGLERSFGRRGTGFELRMPESAFLAVRVVARVVFSLFLPLLLDATAKLPSPPLSRECTRMGNLGIRTLTVFPHGKHLAINHGKRSIKMEVIGKIGLCFYF